MMTSTFPCSKSGRNPRCAPREIQTKKESLIALEVALKKRINEFKELCLKEGELTGYLPIDYPLQPREPIPQIRRRIIQNNNNINTANHNNNNNTNHNVLERFQPYYEETKPFQMSDFYKYSSKHRQKVISNHQSNFKTTRQMQDDVSKKNALRFSSCDDQIQASVKLIEKSGQKLIEATAKAIAGNPGLAEKLSNILPNNNGERY